MNKAVILGGRKTDVVEGPAPRAKEDWVVVKVRASARCTEHKTFVAGPEWDHIDHEGAGDVVEVAQPGRVKTNEDKLLIQEISHRAPSLSQLPRNRRFGFTHLNFDQPLHPSTSYIIGDHDPNREAM